jgi:hypothetical protein
MGHYSSKLCGDDCISVDVFVNECGVSWASCQLPYAVRIDIYNSSDLLVSSVTVAAPGSGYAFTTPLPTGFYIRVFIQNAPTSQFREASVVEGPSPNCRTEVLPDINELLVVLDGFEDNPLWSYPCLSDFNGSYVLTKINANTFEYYLDLHLDNKICEIDWPFVGVVPIYIWRFVISITFIDQCRVWITVGAWADWYMGPGFSSVWAVMDDVYTYHQIPCSFPAVAIARPNHGDLRWRGWRSFNSWNLVGDSSPGSVTIYINDP